MSTSEPMPFSWANIHAATCDDAGNVYVLSSQSESDWTLTSLDPARRVRWATPAPARWGYMESARKLALCAWSASGALVVWTKGQSIAQVVSCVDGRTLGTITGGDANVDLARAQSLAVDRDGSLVSVTAGILRRHTAEGRPMPLWEGNALTELALAPPSKANDVLAFVGWDGATWATTYAAKGMMWGENWDTILPRWRRFDRGGQTSVWSERYFLLYESEVAWADRAGHPFAAWIVAGAYPRVMRYTPDAKSFEYWLLSSAGPQVEQKQFDAELLRPTREPSYMREENVLALAPDGTIWAFGQMDQLRCFGPDGAPTYVSPKSAAAGA